MHLNAKNGLDLREFTELCTGQKLDKKLILLHHGVNCKCIKNAKKKKKQLNIFCKCKKKTKRDKHIW